MTSSVELSPLFVYSLVLKLGIYITIQISDLFNGVVTPFCLLFGSETTNIYNHTNFKEKFIKAQQYMKLNTHSTHFNNKYHQFVVSNF